MLNIQSCAAASLIWLAIVAIAGWALWSLLGLGAPLDLYAAIAESGFGAFLWRNQIMITGLGGFGSLALAYLLDGWRNRTERRQAGDLADKRLASVLSREAMGLAEGLEDVARSGGVAAKSRISELTALGDDLLLTAPMSEIARLGAGAVASTRAVRKTVRRLAGLAEGRDEVAPRPMQVAAIEAAFAARDAARVLDVLVAKGTAAADGLRLLPRSELEIAGFVRDHADQQPTARRLPAA